MSTTDASDAKYVICRALRQRGYPSTQPKSRRIRKKNNKISKAPGRMKRFKYARWWRIRRSLRPSISCGNQQLKNVFRSKYLGTLFTADAKQTHDMHIRDRIATALAQCGKVRSILDSPDLSVTLKLRLYQAAVCLFSPVLWL